MKNIKEVWKALKAGKTVHWKNSLYEITREPIFGTPETVQYQKNHFSCQGNEVLRVTCSANYFGSILEKNDIADLYVKRGK